MEPSTALLVRIGYTAVFVTAAVACFLGFLRARRIDDTETRRGLSALLFASGGWAGSQAGFVAVAERTLATGLYLFGLVLGFATVFAWLYFASAYTGRTYHRESTYRRLALGIYGLVVAVKLTNPYHELYFTTTFVTQPFPHLVVQQGLVHWVTTGFSYALAAVGIFMLLERFAEADYDTGVLAGLVVVTGLPVVIDVAGYASPFLLDVIYAPLGVAAFALGVLFVAEGRFLAVRLAGNAEGAIVLLDERDRIRDYDRAARELLPGLVGAIGDPIDSIVPMATTRDGDGRTVDEGKSARNGTEGDGVDESEILELDVAGETRYYLTTDEPIGWGRADLGRVLVFADVTAIERQRRELERHNDQLEGFAIWVRHELRNALMTVDGYTDWALDAITNGDTEAARRALGTVTAATDRMTRVVDDLATVAQYGRTIEGTEPIDFRRTVAAAWDATETGELALTIEGEGTIDADGARLQELFANAVAFVTHNNASELTVSLCEDGFAIADDGERPPPDATERYFDYADVAPTASAGMALPNVRTLARVHGWTVTVDPVYSDGLCLLVAGALVREHESPPATP